MITNYEIRRFNNEEVLFLYFDFDVEFAKEDLRNQYKNIESYIKHFIKKNKIAFAGSTAIIVVGGSILGNVILNNDSKIDKYNTYALKDRYQEIISSIPSDDNLNNIIVQELPNTSNEDIINDNSINNDVSDVVEETSDSTVSDVVKKDIVKESNSSTINEVINTNDNVINNEPIINENIVVDNNTYITIQRTNGKIINLELEDYITGVVSSEMPALFHPEALKAQAIIARTYALKAMSKGKILTDSNSTQNYKDINQLKSLWGEKYYSYYNKVKEAVSSTKGMYLTYNGSYIEAVYHSTSNGKTENSIYGWGNYYPYLVSVESPYDNLNPSFLVSTTLSYQKISDILGMDVNVDTEFNVIDRTDGDRVKTIMVNDKSFSGTVFRNMIGLRSADFDVVKSDNGVIFTTRGYGHGVGMSQYGANGMAKNGYSYNQILSHYYPGTVINS